ncbi:MAG TPA: TetR family transcriptional regulator [Acetobacteraceae bacterium]|nr:TetR family transcriptional regulator [Acetobacteraceae bacterium]
MKIPRQAENAASPDPRANQKERTRAALVAAAAELLRRGTPPTVAEAAEAAKVSRATAYRYFPTQEALLVEVSQLTPVVAPVEAMLAALPDGESAETRLLRLLDAFNPLIFANEATMRTALRVYLDTWFENRRAGEDGAAVREGRRKRWLDEALAPALSGMSETQWRRLQAALSLTLGSEALIVMKDVCRLEEREGLEVLRWAASTLLRAALEEAAEAVPGAAGREKGRRRAPSRAS